MLTLPPREGGVPDRDAAGISAGAPCRSSRAMSAEGGASEIIVDCPYCGHAWKAEPRWISGPCPNCGLMVYRYMDPKHD